MLISRRFNTSFPCLVDLSRVGILRSDMAPKEWVVVAQQGWQPQADHVKVPAQPTMVPTLFLATSNNTQSQAFIGAQILK